MEHRKQCKHQTSTNQWSALHSVSSLHWIRAKRFAEAPSNSIASWLSLNLHFQASACFCYLSLLAVNREKMREVKRKRVKSGTCDGIREPVATGSARLGKSMSHGIALQLCGSGGLFLHKMHVIICYTHIFTCSFSKISWITSRLPTRDSVHWMCWSQTTNINKASFKGGTWTPELQVWCKIALCASSKKDWTGNIM